MDTQDWTGELAVKQQHKNLQQSFCVRSEAEITTRRIPHDEFATA